jgi:hypothetical protein
MLRHLSVGWDRAQGEDHRCGLHLLSSACA